MLESDCFKSCWVFPVCVWKATVKSPSVPTTVGGDVDERRSWLSPFLRELLVAHNSKILCCVSTSDWFRSKQNREHLTVDFLIWLPASHFSPSSHLPHSFASLCIAAFFPGWGAHGPSGYSASAFVGILVLSENFVNSLCGKASGRGVVWWDAAPQQQQAPLETPSGLSAGDNPPSLGSWQHSSAAS